jgi:hypothetical protein
VVFLLQFDTHFFETFRGKSILYPLTTPVCIYDMTLQPFYLLIVTCTKNKYVFNFFFTFFVLGPVEADDSIFEDHSSDNAARHLRKLPVRAHKLLRR